MGAGDHVPIGRIGDARPPGPGIDDNQAHVWDLDQANLRAARGRERDGGKLQPGLEVIGGTVIDWRKKAVAVAHLSPFFAW
jgi:hypothetical protein